LIESVDEHFVRQMREWTGGQVVADPAASTADADSLLSYFRAQIESRHLDFAQRWLQSQGEGFYTIGSAGHESNAAVALALRPSDPALLHYRSGGFYSARAGQVPSESAVHDVLHGSAASTEDPISGGRHKVFGNRTLNVIPQTSTIGSHMPRAFGLAFSIGRVPPRAQRFPRDAVVVASIGDASLNHSTTLGALNAAGYCTHQGVDVPLLVVCEDNGIGISTPSPKGWVGAVLSSRPGIRYVSASGTHPEHLLLTARALVDWVRSERRPAVLHLRTVRFMGHAGSDAELAYRSRTEIVGDYAHDPLLATAATLIHNDVLTSRGVLEMYEETRSRVMAYARDLKSPTRLASSEAVRRPLVLDARGPRRNAKFAEPERRARAFDGRLPERESGLTLAQALNAALTDCMAVIPHAAVFGEDVSRKGGVYGVTRGLRRAFGAQRVFDTLLDEQTILGTALGMALAGGLPVPEIQYLAYLHNAEDQLRGEAASLRFFSDGQYSNGMVVRIAGLAYQKGFGGHFHNDNSVAVLRDIPGLVLAVPSHAASAPGLVRECFELAERSGQVCILLEPIALYHRRDLHSPADGLMLAPYERPETWDSSKQQVGRARMVRTGSDGLIVTFGNGVVMSLEAAEQLAQGGTEWSVLDLQWLAPLPVDDILAAASHTSNVLVVDETRHSGGVSEAVVSALVDSRYAGCLRRVSSEDSFIPLGPAADHVLLSADQVVDAMSAMSARPSPNSKR
jgi:2-oxoisovalerate dehydrogenase E1 component